MKMLTNTESFAFPLYTNNTQRKIHNLINFIILFFKENVEQKSGDVDDNDGNGKLSGSDDRGSEPF